MTNNNTAKVVKFKTQNKFDSCSKLKGKKIQFTLIRDGGVYSQVKSTFIRPVVDFNHEGVTFNFSGYINREFTQEKNTVETFEILEAYFMEASNGGRGNNGRYDSVAEYFAEPLVKHKVLNVSYGDMFEKMKHSGDADRVSLRLVLKDEKGDVYAIEDNLYEFSPPIEWYSEKFKDQINFDQGFYKDASEAISAFSQKRTDDLFGERYFPLVVFPKNVSRSLIEEKVVWYAKSHSKPIFKDDKIVYGCRCKPHEYADVISLCYEHGGQVPVNRTWSWD